MIEQQKDAAAALGVSPKALRDWMAEPGFPDCSQGYDVAAIEAWRNSRQRKGAELGNLKHAVQVATMQQKLRIEKARADEAEEERERAKGNLLYRDEHALAIREHVTICRDTMIPELLNETCRLVPKEFHRRVQTEGRRVLEAALERLTRGLQSAESTD